MNPASGSLFAQGHDTDSNVQQLLQTAKYVSSLKRVRNTNAIIIISNTM